jgi:iron complex outermembrane recepter protein
VSLSRLTPQCLPQFAQGATFSATAPTTTPPPGIVNACPRSERVAQSSFTPRATIEYRWRDGLLTYLSYAQGFKPGGFNTNETNELAGQSYRKEKVSSYEAGLKSTWLDKRLLLNADVYFNDYKDQQIGIQITNGVGAQAITTAGIVNAGRVHILGFEADVAFQVTDELQLAAAYAYTDATFNEYVQGPPPGSVAADFAACGVPAGQTSSDTNRAEAGNLCADFKGKQVGKNPKHALNLSASYRREIRDGLTLMGEISGLYRSKRYTDESNLAYLDPYWMWGLRAGVMWRNVEVIGFVDNLFDQSKVTSAQRNVDFGNPEGFAPGRAFIAYLPKPRTYGLRVIAKFK